MRPELPVTGTVVSTSAVAYTHIFSEFRCGNKLARALFAVPVATVQLGDDDGYEPSHKRAIGVINFVTLLVKLPCLSRYSNLKVAIISRTRLVPSPESFRYRYCTVM